MAGPPKKPTKLRILEGNPSKRPLPKNEPEPDPTMPECPDWLMDDAKEEWNRVAPELHRIGLRTVGDVAACELRVLQLALGEGLAEHLHELSHAIDDATLDFVLDTLGAFLAA